MLSLGCSSLITVLVPRWHPCTRATSRIPTRSSPTSRARSRSTARRVALLQPTTEGLGLGSAPLGPHLGHPAISFSAPTSRAATSRRGFSTAAAIRCFIAGASTLLCLVLAAVTRARRRVLRRRRRHGHLPGARRALGLPDLPAGHLAVDRAHQQGLRHRSDFHLAQAASPLPILIIGIVYVPYVARPDSRPGALAQGERVRAGGHRAWACRPTASCCATSCPTS